MAWPMMGAAGGGMMGLLSGPIQDWMSYKLVGEPQARQANRWASEASALAWERAVNAYRNRYAWTVNDMRVAGINPIMAATGGFSVGQAPSVETPRVFKAETGRSSFDLASSAKAFKEIDKVEKEIDLLEKKADETVANAAKIRAEQGVLTETEKKINQEYWNARQEFNHITQKAYKTAEDRKLIAAKAMEIYARLVKLNKISNVYKGALGQWMAYIQEVAKTLNLGIAIVPGFGGRGARTTRQDVYHHKAP